MPGDGAVGASLVADPRIAGVAFTGSTEVGRAINRALAAKNGPIVPLIAETGGINAMIVDATALPEQVADDVDGLGVPLRRAALLGAAAALRAGRCRRRHDRHDDRRGARTQGRRSARSGDPCRPGDRRRGQAGLEGWIAAMAAPAACVSAATARGAAGGRDYVAPAIVELDRARDLQEEVFGPVLHVVRWRADELDALLDDIAATGTALTLGIHSRIDRRSRASPRGCRSATSMSTAT